MEQLVIATQNPGKVAELRELLAGLRLEILGLDDLGRAFDEPSEHGRTFEDNAALKALAYAEMTGLPCLADDSGLEVDALNGRPGVDSAWYAYPSEADAKAQPRSVRDPKNIERLLGELEGVPMEQRTARFVCCMAVCRTGILATTRGTFEGRIGIPPRVPAGSHGFGYDPIFLVAPDFARTSAELSPREKNQLSHRAAAARQMCHHLAQIVSEAGAH